MGSDGGIEVSRAAIKRARDALQEVLDDLAPGLSSEQPQLRIDVFTPGGAVSQLDSNPMAFGGRWQAATKFRTSYNTAKYSVDESYTGIVNSLNALVNRLDRAYKNFNAAEGATGNSTASV